MRAAAAVLLAGLAGVPGPASGEDAPVRLEPKWARGERVFVTIVVEDWVSTERLSRLEPVPRELRGPGLVHARTIEYEEQVREVKDGLPTRTMRSFKRYEWNEVTEEKPRRHACQGRLIECRRVDGVLRGTREIRDPSYLLDDAMERGTDWAWLVPREPVAPGASWKIRDWHLAVLHPELGKGETTCTVASVEGDLVLIRFRKEEETWGRDQTSNFRGEATFSLGMGRVVTASMELVRTSQDRKLGKVMGAQRILFEHSVLGEKEDAAPSKAASIRLRPAWRSGERVLVRLVTTDHATDAGLLGTRSVEYEEKATEVKDGLPTRVQRTFKRFEAQRSSEDGPRKHALAGRTVEFRSVDGVLQCTEDIPDLAPDPMCAGADWSWLLPGKRMVAVGDSWQVPPGMHLSTVHLALVRPGAKCELAGIKNGVASLRFDNGAGLTGGAEFSLWAGRVTKGHIDTVVNGDGKSSTRRVTFDLEILEGGD
jgi:hypothetical protein